MEETTYRPRDEGAADAEWPRQALPDLAADFGRSVQEASGHLGSAAEQFLSMTTRFLAAGSRLDLALDAHRQIEAESQRAAVAAQTAAAEAAAAAERANAAQSGAEGFQTQVERNYGELTTLVRDLQERIAALAVLSRPLPAEPPPALASEPEAPELTVVKGRAVWGDASDEPESAEMQA